MTESERVLVTREPGGVVHVRLNRPDKRNGLDRAMFEGIIAAGESLLEDVTARAVVLSGAGPAFCAGLDFMSFMSGGPEVQQALLARGPESPANVAQRVAWIWREVPVPVIAALHGPVFGGGLQIALGADIRLASSDARLSVMEIRWGLIPDMSITQTLPGLVRDDIARELIYTGRVVEAEEAARIGLVTRVVEEPLEAALEMARVIAGKNPHAIRANKRLLAEAPAMSTAEALALETELQVPLLGSPNQMEAVQANFQKRAPRFEDVES